MTISVTELKARLLEVIRELERDQKAVDIERHGRIVARLIPASDVRHEGRPWGRLQGSGTLLSEPEESVLEEAEFEALR